MKVALRSKKLSAFGADSFYCSIPENKGCRISNSSVSENLRNYAAQIYLNNTKISIYSSYDTQAVSAWFSVQHITIPVIETNVCHQ